ncbi:MAG TPA: HAD-IIIA family hydrolase [Polyangiaceae bacterium]
MGIDQISAKGIVLDRDGTLIDVYRDEELGVLTTAFHPSQVRLLPGVVEGLTLLRDAGYRFGIATNQPGPAKGQYSPEAIRRTNAALLEILAKEGLVIEHVAICMHHPVGGPGGDASLVFDCPCRKPKAGMLVEVLDALGLDPAKSWMLGDTTSDVEAGKTAGLRTGLLFDTKRCELCPLRAGVGSGRGVPDASGANFLELARSVLAAG